MHTKHTILALAALSASLAAQNSLVFTGRFPFQSLDTPNERLNGSINKLEEFDFSVVTPGLGAVARTMQPATAHQAYIGDSNNDGNYTKFAGFKTYFQNIQMGGLFVKSTDKALVTSDKVFFTVRSNAAPLQIEAFSNGGTTVSVIRPGDFVRFTGGGNLEYFITQARSTLPRASRPLDSPASRAPARCARTWRATSTTARRKAASGSTACRAAWRSPTTAPSS